MSESDSIDVESLMEEVRRRVRERRGASGRVHSGPSGPGPAANPEIASLGDQANVYDVRFRSHRRFLGPFIVRVFEFFRLLLTPILTRQSAYNAASARALETLSERICQVEALREQLDQRLGQLEGNVLQPLREETRALAQRLDELHVLAASDRTGALPTRLSKVERSMRRIVHILANGTDGDPVRARPLPPKALEPAFDLVAFENRFRGTEGDIRERQKAYVGLFRGRAPVLDLGSGRGEFLELLRDEGIAARGVDTDLDMVLLCRERGLSVDHDDALTRIASLDDGALGGIFSAQLVEHLEPARIVELVRLCHRKLRPDGVLVIETPNPSCLAVFARSFYMDLTHVRPVHPETMRHLFEALGFRSVDIRYVSPAAERLQTGSLEELGTITANARRRLEQLSEIVFGFEDYAAIGRK